MDHLSRTFFVEEPLNLCVGMISAGANRERLESVCRDTLQEGLSVAVLKGGKVVGAALNGAQTREQMLRTEHELSIEP